MFYSCINVLGWANALKVSQQQAERLSNHIIEVQTVSFLLIGWL